MKKVDGNYNYGQPILTTIGEVLQKVQTDNGCVVYSDIEWGYDAEDICYSIASVLRQLNVEYSIKFNWNKRVAVLRTY